MTIESGSTGSTVTSDAASTPRIGHILARYRKANDLSDDDLAKQLGLATGSLIRQVIAGTMPLPLTLLEPLAEILEMDKFDLLDRWLRERDSVLHALFAEIRERCTLTDAELRLIGYCRKLADGRPSSPLLFDGRGVIALFAG